MTRNYWNLLITQIHMRLAWAGLGLKLRRLSRELQGCLRHGHDIFCLTNQTFCKTLPRMLDPRIKRLLDAYPAIFLACHRQHVREDEAGKIITEHQASILSHLQSRRSTTLSKLAEHMGVGRSTMSITVARLVRGGYIARSRDKDDARRIALTLTAIGVRVKEQNTVLEPELVRAMFRAMPARELETALQGMECMAKHARIMLRQRKRGRDQ